MVKRFRESKILIKEINQNYTIIQHSGRTYSVYGQPHIGKIIGNPDYECDVVYKDNHPVLTVERLRSGEIILSQKIWNE